MAGEKRSDREEVLKVGVSAYSVTTVSHNLDKGAVLAPTNDDATFSCHVIATLMRIHFDFLIAWR